MNCIVCRDLYPTHYRFCTCNCLSLCLYVPFIENNLIIRKKIAMFVSLDIPFEVKFLVVRKIRQNINDRLELRWID